MTVVVVEPKENFFGKDRVRYTDISPTNWHWKHGLSAITQNNVDTPVAAILSEADHMSVKTKLV